MSFDLVERSVDSGQPFILMVVAFLTNVWSYTNADSDIVYDGRNHTPMPIKHDAIKQTGDVSKSTITVSVPADCPVGELFRIQPPAGVVSLTLLAKHIDEPEAKAFWKGRIVNAEWEHPWLKLTVENVFSSLKCMGLRRKYATQCQLSVYSQGLGMCNVDREQFKTTGPASVVDGLNVTVPAFIGKPMNYFAGGELTWTHAVTGYLERRMIVSSTADGVVELMSPPQGLVPASPVAGYAGCDHSPGVCDSKFDNSINYGGMRYIPRKNPFGGATLY